MTPPPDTLIASPPSPKRVPTAEEVHVWTASVEHDQATPASYGLLSDIERRRAERYRFERDRMRFEPQRVEIALTAAGRPVLDQRGEVTFSVSHADGRAVVAVAGGNEVGVDLERLRTVPDALVVAEGLFTERELEALLSTPAALRSRAFLTLWTRKEALAKAVGAGLSISLDGIDVSPLEAPGAVVHVPLPGASAKRACAFVAFDTCPGFVATVALTAGRVVVTERHDAMVAA